MQNQSSSFMTSFLKLEAAGGILLMFSAILAIVFANTFLTTYYELLLSTPIEIRIGALEIAKPLLLWINDGKIKIIMLNIIMPI